MPRMRFPAAACVLATMAFAPADVRAACAGASSVPTAHASRTHLRSAVRCLLNDQRHRHGLHGVHASPRLTWAAQRHADDMVHRHFFAHVSPAGSTLMSRVHRTGYLHGARGFSLGETLAWGRSWRATPRMLVSALMHSPPHRAIILSAGFRQAGIGIAAAAPYGGDGATLTVDFGRARRAHHRHHRRHHHTHAWYLKRHR